MSDRAITIGECVFGGRFVVTIEPRSIAWPSQEFRAFADADKHAQALSAHHGWPVINKTGGAE